MMSEKEINERVRQAHDEIAANAAKKFGPFGQTSRDVTLSDEYRRQLIGIGMLPTKNQNPVAMKTDYDDDEPDTIRYKPVTHNPAYARPDSHVAEERAKVVKMFEGVKVDTYAVDPEPIMPIIRYTLRSRIAGRLKLVSATLVRFWLWNIAVPFKVWARGGWMVYDDRAAIHALLAENMAKAEIQNSDTPYWPDTGVAAEKEVLDDDRARNVLPLGGIYTTDHKPRVYLGEDMIGYEPLPKTFAQGNPYGYKPIVPGNPKEDDAAEARRAKAAESIRGRNDAKYHDW